MALDMCLESYGAVVYVVDSLLSSGFTFRSIRGGTPTDQMVDNFDCSVRRAVVELPFAQSQAVWLVDVCGCTYEQAATEVRCSRDQICDRVTAGRRAIRATLLVEPGEPADRSRAELRSRWFSRNTASI